MFGQTKTNPDFEGKQKLTQSCVCFAAKKREQSQEDGQIVKLSWLNGMMKAEEKEERRELITAALREALTVTGFVLL